MEEAREAGAEGLGLRREVRAAGGVPYRRNGDDLEVLLVHRPKYRDWTFPKGKVKDGETDEQAARREVEEEAGLEVELGPELTSTTYTDSRLRKKTVRYWAMGPVSKKPQPRTRWTRSSGSAARRRLDGSAMNGISTCCARSTRFSPDDRDPARLGRP